MRHIAGLKLTIGTKNINLERFAYYMKVPIYECVIGDILEADVFNESGLLLVTRDTVMNDYIKHRLIDMGIREVSLYKPAEQMEYDKHASYKEFQKDYKKTVLEVKKIITDLSVGKELDYEKIINIADFMYNSIDQSDEIIRYLNDIRQADEYTYNHCVNVGFYSMLMGKWMALSYNDTRKLIQAGLAHDIGKIKIPTDILNKKGKLTVEEFETIKKHPSYGYDILMQAKGIDTEVKKAVLLHHERMDGSGYPLSVPSESIGLYTKIVAIADVYDAMTSDRPYKSRRTPFEAFDMFLSIGISIFDLSILKIFLNNLAANYIGIDVMLDNGKTGKVVYIPPHDITKPVLCVDSHYIDLSKEKQMNIICVL